MYCIVLLKLSIMGDFGGLVLGGWRGKVVGSNRLESLNGGLLEGWSRGASGGGLSGTVARLTSIGVR